ncbi:hypothetical protein [Streptomyces anulatus]
MPADTLDNEPEFNEEGTPEEEPPTPPKRGRGRPAPLPDDTDQG